MKVFSVVLLGSLVGLGESSPSQLLVLQLDSDPSEKIKLTDSFSCWTVVLQRQHECPSRLSSELWSRS